MTLYRPLTSPAAGRDRVQEGRSPSVPSLLHGALRVGWLDHCDFIGD